MVKRTLLLILIVLCMAYSAGATAYTERLFSGWVYAGSSYNTEGGHTLDVLGYFDNCADMELDAAGEFMVKLGECLEKTEFTLCFNSTAFSHYNSSLPNREVYKLLVEVRQAISFVELSRSFDLEQAYEGQGITITSTMRNPSNKNAAVYFSDGFNSSFDIAADPGCPVKGSNATWQGTLNAGQEKTCKYVITGMGAASFSSIAFAEYNNGITLTKARDSRAITILERPFSTTLNASRAEFSREFEINVTLKALADLQAEYTLTIPQAFEIVSWKKIDGLERKSNVFTYYKNMDADEADKFNIVLTAKGIGTQTLSEEIKFTANTYTQRFTKDTKIYVIHTPPTLAISGTVLPKENSTLLLTISNPSDQLMKSVALTLKSDINLNRTAYTFSELTPGGAETVMLQFYGEPGSHSLAVELVYNLENNQQAKLSKTYEIFMAGLVPPGITETAPGNATNETAAGNATGAGQAGSAAQEGLSPVAKMLIASPVIIAFVAVVFLIIRRRRQII